MGKKRGNNEGSIFQRSRDGRWVAQVTVPGTGKTRSRVARTREGAARMLLELQNDLVTPTRRQSKPMTLAAYLEDWLEESVRLKRKPKTAQSYETSVRCQIAPHLGDYQLHELEQGHLRRWHNALLRQGLSARTVHNAHAVLRNALGVAFEDGLLPVNVASSRSARPPAAPKSQRPYAEKDDVDRLIRHAQGKQPVWSLIELAAHTGLRRGELLALRWTDVDLAGPRRRIVVRHSLERVPGVGLRLGRTKSEAGRREVPLNAFAYDAAVRLAGSDSEYVFTGSTGHLIDPTEASRKVKRVAVAAGVPWLTLHILRHSFLTAMVNSGVPISVAYRLLGHSNPSVTLEVYSHVSYRDLEGAVHRIWQS